MVSAASLKTLSRGGGRYILCMPIHWGGEIAEEARRTLKSGIQLRTVCHRAPHLFVQLTFRLNRLFSAIKYIHQFAYDLPVEVDAPVNW